jgi:hypothetical protein
MTGLPVCDENLQRAPAFNTLVGVWGSLGQASRVLLGVEQKGSLDMENASTPTPREQDFFARKVAIWFNAFDASHDSLITRSDLALTADRLSTACGVPGDHEAAVEWTRLSLTYWNAFEPSAAAFMFGRWQ